MFGLSFNISERCYLEETKKTLGATDTKELCEKIVVLFSYGQVSSEAFRNHYDPSLWVMRKVSWILSAPFRLAFAIAALALSAIDVGRRDYLSSKTNLYSAVRFVEYAIGDLICIFNDRIGQHWTTDAYVHIKLYTLASQQSVAERQLAFDECLFTY